MDLENSRLIQSPIIGRLAHSSLTIGDLMLTVGDAMMGLDGRGVKAFVI